LTDQIKIIVSKIDDETRIDRWLKKRFSLLTQSFIENKLRRGLIRINHKKIRSNYIVLAGDIVTITEYSGTIFSKIKISKSKKFIPKRISIKFQSSIIYESSDFIILNKWTGVSTQGAGKIDISINDIIKSISEEYNLVHRLDKDTSGLLIIAKNYKSAKFFSKLFRNHEVEKIYLAICQGIPKNLNSTVKLKMSKKSFSQNSQTITKYKTVNTSKKLSLMLYKPLTGKTHQLRIVSKYLNCPIIGDKKYSINDKYLREQLKLNAYFLKFVFKNHQFEFKSIIPKNFLEFMKNNNLVAPKDNKLINLLKIF